MSAKCHRGVALHDTPCGVTEIIMEIPPKLREYLDRRRSSLPPITNPDEPLQLDSLGLVRLVAFLENDLGIRIEDEELIADNFHTLRQIGQLLATKRRLDLQAKPDFGMSCILGTFSRCLSNSRAGNPRVLPTSISTNYDP
jgi:acyl carrier protein